MHQLYIAGQLEANIFADRQNIVSQHYLTIFREPGSYVSNAFSCENVFRQHSGIVPFFSFTNIVYRAPSSEILDNFYKQIAADIAKDYSHILSLDIFGRIVATYTVNCKVGLFESILSYPGLPGDCIKKNIVLPPFNRINICNDLLSCDPLGFRLVKSCSRVFENDAESVYTIVILGGSFAASIYSLPGESFSDILQARLNGLDNDQRTYQVINLSMGSCQQGDNFSHLIHFGLLASADLILWIDGLNDLCCGFPLSESLGIDLPINTNAGDTPLVPKSPFSQCDPMAKISSYLHQRSLYLDVIRSYGTKVVNMLQPICPVEHSSCFTDNAASLLPFFDQGWSLYSDYLSILSYIPLLSESQYDFEFHLPLTSDQLEFWDIAHLSPRGELVFADLLFDYLSSRIL
jgi:hypothetical protein